MIPQLWQDKFREYRPFIQAASITHSIPQEIICGIISQESAWNPWSMRYEPAFTDRYVIPAYPKSSPTFRVQHGSSWGLMQIMGLVARELGCKDNLLYLLLPEIGITWGCRKLAALSKRYGAGKGRIEEYGTRGVLGQDVIASFNQGNDRWVDEDADGVHDINERYRNQDYVSAVLGYADEWSRIIGGGI